MTHKGWCVIKHQTNLYKNYHHVRGICFEISTCYPWKYVMEHLDYYIVSSKLGEATNEERV